jgi:type II secretory pathway pseudopilin PulG
VVISIIGLLSSVVLASLNSARFKAKDAAIKAEGEQLRTIMAYNFLDYGSYSNLSPNNAWVSSGSTCSALSVSGTYATQFKQICTAILNNESGRADNLYFYSGVDAATVSDANVSNFSLLLWLPGAQTWECIWSSGAVSFTNSGDWTKPGCWKNP